jgi:hypothetical protein
MQNFLEQINEKKPVLLLGSIAAMALGSISGKMGLTAIAPLSNFCDKWWHISFTGAGLGAVMFGGAFLIRSVIDDIEQIEGMANSMARFSGLVIALIFASKANVELTFNKEFLVAVSYASAMAFSLEDIVANCVKKESSIEASH